MYKFKKTNNYLKRFVAVMMLFTLIFSLSACGVRKKEEGTGSEAKGSETGAGSETKKPEVEPGSETKEPEIEPSDKPETGIVETVTLDDETKDKLYDATGDFAFELLKNCDESGENILISPISVVLALGMTANGGTGETLEEMEKLLGGEGADIESLNAFYKEYMEKLQGNDKIKVSIANSVWINKDVVNNVKDAFMSTLNNCYDAKAYNESFNNDVVEKVNTWVKENTDGMIEKLLDQLEGSEVMILINAICFDGEWQKIYYENQVRETVFTNSSGDEVDVEGMYSDEDWYIEDENTTGVIKDYKGGYRFVALLPNEDVSIDDYVASLTYDKYKGLMNGKKEAIVQTMLPKFQYDYSKAMKEVLKDMGMPKAFEAGKAEFTNITDDDISINIGSVIHKTYIEVGEKGTRAAAVTAVVMDSCESFEEKEIKSVTLDRAFVYMIIDEETEMPLFMGVVRDM